MTEGSCDSGFAERRTARSGTRGDAPLGPSGEVARERLLAPGSGAQRHLSGGSDQVSPAGGPQPLATFEVLGEGEKSGSSQEYLPPLARHGTTSFFSWESGNLDGKKVVQMGSLLNRILDDFNRSSFLHSKSQPLGVGNEQVFPLPLSSKIIRGSSYPEMVVATCRALNLLHGESAERKKADLSPACRRALEFVVRCVENMGRWEDFFTPINFDIFFRSKGVDYRGEEVKIAQRFSWKSISPALPPEVGGVSLIDFCTLGTKFYVENFPKFLVPPEKQFLGRSPTVMVKDEDWFSVCEGLITSRICGIIPLDEVYHIHGRPLLGGLFGVGKGEFIDNLETQRLIMNFVPLNENCRPVDSDIATLPGISGLNPFMLEDGEIAIISSEDIKCFFYLFSLPACWFPFLGFNKDVPEGLLPCHLRGRRCVLHARVLPMGFRNSVGVAQHIHRNVISSALTKSVPPIGGQGELRKDRPASSASELYRIYLDNFDVITKTDPVTASLIAGKPGLMSLIARQAYSDAHLPRHPKKSVCQKTVAEVQGAIVDGELGIAYPKPPKVALYVGLALELLRRGSGTQRELQVVCGGFVYFCMFRRPLLAALNSVWAFIEGFKAHPPVVRLPLPATVRLELARFCALIPLARLDFRLRCMGQVTASDASSSGGGACVSTGLTSYGAAAANASVRGDLPEEHDLMRVLSVGLFDGVGCLRMACDVL